MLFNQGPITMCFHHLFTLWWYVHLCHDKLNTWKDTNSLSILCLSIINKINILWLLQSVSVMFADKLLSTFARDTTISIVNNKISLLLLRIICSPCLYIICLSIFYWQYLTNGLHIANKASVKILIAINHSSYAERLHVLEVILIYSYGKEIL